MPFLTLSRNIGEKIIIGDNEVAISVSRIKGKQIFFNIIADEKITIHREEIYQAIKKGEDKGKKTVTCFKPRRMEYVAQDQSKLI